MRASDTFQRDSAVNWGFDRLPGTRDAICRCPRSSEGTIILSQRLRPDSGIGWGECQDMPAARRDASFWG